MANMLALPCPELKPSTTHLLWLNLIKIKDIISFNILLQGEQINAVHQIYKETITLSKDKLIQLNFDISDIDISNTYQDMLK